jgi:pyochelin biosynthetic protein PchC
VRALNDVPCPADRLVCFPFSGGSAATYRAWSPELPADVQLVGVQYPGQADRLAEAPASSVAEMARSVAAELSELDAARCSLFGHSLGALVAYETAKVLQDNGTPVHHLFVSGARAPSHAGGGTAHLAGDGELWSALCDLGAVPPDVADDAELRDLLLPGLRAYIAVTETYRPAPRSDALRCRVRCYHNTGDPLVDHHRIGAWAAVSTGEFTTRAWPGGHFAFLADPAELVADVLAALRESGAAQ